MKNKLFIILVICLIFLFTIIFLGKNINSIFHEFQSIIKDKNKQNHSKLVNRFNSKEELEEYLNNMKNADSLMLYDNNALNYGNSNKVFVENIKSKENIKQIDGLDAIDIVKADDKNLFILTAGLRKIKATPVSDLNIIESLEFNKGGVLLDKNILVVVDDKYIRAFNNNSKLENKWNMEIDKGVQIRDIRAVNGYLYLILQKNIDKEICPVNFLKIDGKDVNVSCDSIYYPKNWNNFMNSVLTVFQVKLDNGKIAKSISFLEHDIYDKKAVYISKDNLYISYINKVDDLEIMKLFLEEYDVFPEYIEEKIIRILNYELLEENKRKEIDKIFFDYKSKLPKEELKILENKFNSLYREFINKRGSEFLKTLIIKISFSDLKIYNDNLLSGSLIDEYSIDEYNGNLNIVVENLSNDYSLHVLDNDMKLLKSISDITNHKRLLTGRFIRDKFYFSSLGEHGKIFIFDVEDIEKNKSITSLETNAFVEHLYEVDNNLILSIENDTTIKVKFGLFDVSDSNHPKKIKNGVWIDDVSFELFGNNYTFSRDTKDKLFFVSGIKNGYGFSYKNGKLKLVVSAISDNYILRAHYIGNYMYIITDTKILVFDKRYWILVNELEYTK